MRVNNHFSVHSPSKIESQSMSLCNNGHFSGNPTIRHLLVHCHYIKILHMRQNFKTFVNNLTASIVKKYYNVVRVYLQLPHDRPNPEMVIVAQ